MFGYLNEISEEENPIKLDVIALCCEFSEYKNLEIIIYDDGSTDETKQIVKYFAKNTKRIRYVFNKRNAGVGHARNKLLDLCNTKYACWMDSDDISNLERIKLQAKEMTGDKLVFCGWENLKNKTAGTTLGFATLLFPVNVNIRFNEKMLWGGEDWDWIEKMRKAYPEILVNKVLYSIDFHGNRIGSWKRKIDKEWGGIYDLKDIQDLTYEEVIEKYKREK